MSKKLASGAPGPPPSDVPLPKMKRGLRSFFRDVVREMKHVTWPKRQETNRLTGVVIAVCTGLTVLLLVLSTLFDGIFRALFRQ